MTNRITIVETPLYLSDADYAGMEESDRDAVSDVVSQDPQGGDLVKGSGGVRKIRVARPGGGKSGGWRVLTAFVGMTKPVYLLAVFAKSDRGNISAAEVQELAKLMKELKSK